MKRVLVVTAMFAAAPVAAEPTVQGERCRVTIARAPDDVRATIEEWVRAEPVCTVGLEIRVVATEGGLYLLARDDDGRVRERVVPDAQSAGVLVASWVAADSASPPSPYAIRKPEPMMQQELIGNEGMQAPGMTPITVTSPRPKTHPKFFTLGGMFAMSGTGGGGVRAEIDMKSGSVASFGFAGSASRSGIPVYTSGNTVGSLDTFDAKVVGYVGATARFGKWHLRSSVGLGLVFTAAQLNDGGNSQSAQGVFPTGEASIALGRALKGRWAIYGGPILSIYSQEYQVMSAYYYQSLERRDAELMMFLGVRHKL